MKTLEEIALEESGMWCFGDRDTKAFTKTQIIEFAHRLLDKIAEQSEPVVWMHPSRDPHLLSHSAYTYGSASIPLYLHPPKPDTSRIDEVMRKTLALSKSQLSNYKREGENALPLRYRAVMEQAVDALEMAYEGKCRLNTVPNALTALRECLKEEK